VTNRIHSTAIIGAGVEIGEDNVIGPFSVVSGPTRIGSGNWIGPHVSVGTAAEFRGGVHPAGWDGELDGAGVAIGDGNVIREFVTINQGTSRPTQVGDDCYLLARSHVGHDCRLDIGVTLGDGVVLGGHTHVWAWANLGMAAVVHQRTQVGPGAMVGMASAVRKDAEAFMVTVGNPARAVRLNVVGLARLGCDDPTIAAFESFLKGDAELPSGLPPDLAAVVRAWLDAAAECS
jgi:UDP-N-acetylglucosamine acyltransferase